MKGKLYGTTCKITYQYEGEGAPPSTGAFLVSTGGSVYEVVSTRPVGGDQTRAMSTNVRSAIRWSGIRGEPMSETLKKIQELHSAMARADLDYRSMNAAGSGRFTAKEIAEAVKRSDAADLAYWTEVAAVCERASLQSRVLPWLMDCFGPIISGDTEERNHRFFEEATELIQSAGCSRSEAHQLVDYVFDRPAGALQQEVGGVMITLAALCLAQDIDMHECGEAELARIWTKVDQIREKQAAKPKHSPLPAPTAAPDAPVTAAELDDNLTTWSAQIERGAQYDSCWMYRCETLIRDIRTERAERDRDAAAIVDFVETLEVIADHSKDSAGRARVVMQSNRTVIKAARERVK